MEVCEEEDAFIRKTKRNLSLFPQRAQLHGLMSQWLNSTAATLKKIQCVLPSHLTQRHYVLLETVPHWAFFLFCQPPSSTWSITLAELQYWWKHRQHHENEVVLQKHSLPSKNAFQVLMIELQEGGVGQGKGEIWALFLRLGNILISILTCTCYIQCSNTRKKRQDHNQP